MILFFWFIVCTAITRFQMTSNAMYHVLINGTGNKVALAIRWPCPINATAFKVITTRTRKITLSIRQPWPIKPTTFEA